MNVRLAQAAAVVLLAAGALTAHAHGSVRFGIGIGIPAPWYYAPPPVYYPYYPPVVVAPPPSAYVEQAPSNVYSTRPAPAVYYYCAASQGYYPYVRDCPEGWQQVPAQPR